VSNTKNDWIRTLHYYWQMFRFNELQSLLVMETQGLSLFT
jgi:hypothetical protein